MVSNPKWRHTLNNKQLILLQLVYKFRFITVKLLQVELQQKDQSVINGRLKVLLEQGYIGRRFENSYKLAGKQASYYLLAPGLRALQPHLDTVKPETFNKVMFQVQKNTTVTDQFIDHCLNIFAVYNQFRTIYGSNMHFFTKTELMSYSYFPNPLPDAMLSLKVNDSAKRFFVEVLDSSVSFSTYSNKIRSLIEYADGGKWDKSGRDFPVILLFCETAATQRSAQTRTRKLLSFNDSDVIFYTTTQAAFMQANPDNDTVWQLADDPDELVSLR